MRLIDADKIHPDVRTQHGALAISQGQLAYAKTVNAIVIPENATNRDVIRELWHDETLLSNIEYCYGEEWLNAPYKAESEDRE